ncbi:MAG: FAD-dependent oxidoreductase [Candidatus Rokuibacteriota bacterium]|nr:MAG: FAD-dependent oxidoreductase [Candidatus Rokubacteria bacterium]
MTQARVVIIGGGIAGCSVAYHLVKLGWRDVVLLERKQLTSGTTWHAAGLIGRLRGSRTMAGLVRYSAELYARLEAETGVSTNWKQVGSLGVARRAARMTQFRRSVALGRYAGIEAHIVDRDEIRRRWPLCRVDDLEGGIWIPHDGRVIPADTTQALAAGARAGGARIVEETAVREVLTRDGAVAGVRTSHGEIACDVVVNCAGMWARELGALNGITVPVFPVEHFYAVTRPIAGVSPDLPVLRDYDGHIYVREEVGGLLVGGFEPVAKPWHARVPDDFAFGTLKEDWDQFRILMENGVQRIPALDEAQIQLLFDGPESFTPDGGFILGEAPGLRGYFIAAGFNSGGIAYSGGAGRALAEWIVGGHMPMDLWSVDPRRFAAFHGEPRFLAERMREVPGLHYRMAWPLREHETGRGLLRSALHERLAARGASFGARMGWERANWLTGNGAPPAARYTFARPDWLAHVAREHQAARTGAALFDQSSFAKFLVTGAGAERALQWVAAGDVAVPVGRTVYTPLLNERGGYESDLTISRIAPDTFFVVTSSAQRVRDADWIRSNLPRDAKVTLADVTEEFGTFSLMGPLSREVLARATRARLDNGAFPYGSVRDIDVAGVTVRAVRLSYVGELGWELYVATAQAPAVYDAIMSAGGVIDAGYYALDSLRLEKGYRAWGHELTPEDTPLEAGMAFTIAWDKPGGFIGRDALVAQRQSGVTRRLLLFALDETPLMAWGEEPIYRNGACVGVLTSVGFGHTVRRLVGMGYVPLAAGERAESLLAGRWEIDVEGTRVSATPSLRAWHDPTGARMKG